MRPDWKVSFITFVFQYAYAPLSFDLDLVSEYHRAAFLGTDVGNRVLKTHLLQTVIKPFDWFEWYIWFKMAFKMSQEFPTASMNITEDFHILHSAYVYICYSILKAKTYNCLLNKHTHTHQQQLHWNKKQLGTSHRLLTVIWLAEALLLCAKFRPLRVIIFFFF